MKFSVIIPAYNAEKYIEHCLNSIINQDYPANDYEVIVVDDCSPDGQNDVIERYTVNYPPPLCEPINGETTTESKKKDFPLVRLIKHDVNKRQGGARNTGLEVAQGEWIFFVDSDDYWCRNDVLKCFSEIIDRYNDIDIVESFTHVDVEDWSEINIQNSKLDSISCYSGRDYILKSGHYSGYVWRSVYKKDYISGFRFRENVFFEDSDWRLNVIKSAKRIVEMDFPFYAYVNNQSSTIRGKNIEVFYANVDSNILLLEIFSNSEDEELKRYGYSRIKSNIFSWFKISKDFDIKDSVAVIKYAASTDLFDESNYQLSLKEKVMFNSLKYIPFLTLSAVKSAVLLRRQLRKMI